MLAIAVGGSTNVSIKLGENNREEAERVIGSTVALELTVGIVMTILICIFFLDINTLCILELVLIQ